MESGCLGLTMPTLRPIVTGGLGIFFLTPLIRVFFDHNFFRRIHRPGL